MAVDPSQQIGELLSAPLEQLLVALGAGIGRAQAELDHHSIAIQEEIDQHPLLSQYGIESTWYQIPTTNLELKVAVVMQETSSSESPPTGPGGRPIPVESIRAGLPTNGAPAPEPVPRLWVQPVNARLTNQFGFNVDAASTVTLSIVAVPPPGPAAAGTPSMTRDEALQTAQELLVADPDGHYRLTVNYNGGARAWFVVQTDETQTPPRLVSYVKVDDQTKQILRSEQYT